MGRLLTARLFCAVGIMKQQYLQEPCYQAQSLMGQQVRQIPQAGQQGPQLEAAVAEQD